MVSLAVGTAIASVVGAGAAVFSGVQQKKAADYNAAVANRDADAAKIKAKYDESIHRDRVKRILSAQRSAIGKSGLDISGSPLLATMDTIEAGELDALAIRQGGDVSSQRFRSSAAMSKLQGKSALTSSVLGAGSTLLTGGLRAKQIQRAA